MLLLLRKRERETIKTMVLKVSGRIGTIGGYDRIKSFYIKKCVRHLMPYILHIVYPIIDQ